MKVFTTLLLSVVLLTGSVTASTIQERIQKKYATSAAFSIEFDQSIYWSVREKTSKKRGTLLIAPGDKFRIELADQTYVSNGTVCWQYSSRNKQVVIRNLSDINLSFHPSRLLATFLDEYSFSEKQSGPLTVLSTTDTTLSSEYKAISITAERATGTVKLLEFTDSNDNLHTYSFKKTVFNKKLSLTIFEFEVPADADIIDHRK